MKVRYTPRAYDDLDDIYNYLDKHLSDTAQLVKALTKRRIAWLADFPLMAPETDEPGVRELTIARYPYKVYYELAGDEVWILHIRHTSRKEW